MKYKIISTANIHPAPNTDWGFRIIEEQYSDRHESVTLHHLQFYSNSHGNLATEISLETPNIPDLEKIVKFWTNLLEAQKKELSGKSNQ